MRSRKTIKEIATVTGFSTATVDRVINGREGVKDETRKKILLAAKELSYKNMAVRAPDNLMGQILKTAIIIPDTDNELINRLSAAIEEKSRSAKAMVIQVYRYENLSAKSLTGVLEEISENGIDVIGIVGVDDPHVSLLLNRMNRNGVRIITLLSIISGITPVAHIGINDNAAGRTAGLLMAKTRPDAAGAVLVFTGSTQYQGHLQREIGFRGILRESGIPVRVTDSFETHEDRSHNTDFALKHFQASNDIAGVYVIGSGAAEVIDALDKTPMKSKPVVVCHDMTESVMNKLFNGKVDYIIHQDLFIEASNFITVVENIFEGREPELGCLPVRINIVTAENIYSNEF